ncbi:ABC transporter permease [Psychroserpens sp. MEBiC05023]
MLQTWFKIFFRNSKRNWLNVFINILGLTLGLAGLLIVLLFFNDELSYNQWNPNKDDVYRITNKSRENGFWFSSTAGQMIFYKSDIPEVEATLLTSPFYRGRVVSFGNKNVFTEKSTHTEPNFFDFFPFDVTDGSYQKFSESRTHIAISEGMAERLFGAETAIEQVVDIGGYDYVITCIYKIPNNSHYEPELLMQYSKPFEVHWGNFQNELFVKLTKSTNLAAVKQKMDNVIIERNVKPMLEAEGLTLEEARERYGFMESFLEKLDTIRLHHIADYAGPEGKGNYQLLLILLSLSVLLIIISCVNVINLSTASASQRAKEVGVKKTLGLSKNTLMFQYIFEIAIQGILALFLALVLVEFVLPYFNEFMGKEISILEPTILLKVTGIATLIAFLVGVIPALYLSNFKTIEVLKGNFSRSKKGVIIRHAMLGLQFLISGFFLIGVLVIYNQMSYMMNKDLGFKNPQTIDVEVFNIKDEYRKYMLTRQVMSQHENVIDVSTCMLVPGEGNVNGTALRYKDKSFNTASNTVDFNYTDFAGLEFVKGRGFSEKFASDTISSILINETAAKRLGIYDNPIGKHVRVGWMDDDDERKLEVVGMVKDYHFDGFDVKIDPMFFVHMNTFPFTKDWIHSIQFKVKPHNISKTIADIETFWKQNVDSKFPFQYEFIDKKFAETYEKYQKQQTMFLIVSVIVILISLLGLFALATLTIQQRLKEVAIRKTLGASVKEIIIQLIKQFLKIIGVASIILLPIAYYFMQNWLDNFIYRIDMPIWPYIVTPIVLLILVFTVVGFKAYNATKVDLIKYLKFE